MGGGDKMNNLNQKLNLSKKILGSLICTLGFAFANTALAEKLEEISIRLDWTPWAVHAPFHLAKEKGWFKEAGLDVEIEDGNGSVTTVQIVGSRDQFDVGQAALASMVIARNKGLPVKALAPFAVTNDIGVLVPSDSDMNSPADLKGKTVVYTAGSLEAPFIDAFLAAGGLTRKDVNLLSVDASSKASTYMVGRADAVVSTIPFVFPSVAAQRESKVIPFADYGLDMVSFGLFTSESSLEKKREPLAKFAAVVSKTWEYIYSGHEQEAVDAIIAQRPQARLKPEVLKEQLAVLKNYFVPLDQKRVGVNEREDWEKTIKTLTEVGMLENEMAVEDYYVPNFFDPNTYDEVLR